MSETQAAKRFKAFHGRHPGKGDLMELQLNGNDIVLAIGTMTRIAYIAKGERQERIHSFEGNRPQLFVSSDGKQIYILRGGYKFTSRGFEG